MLESRDIKEMDAQCMSECVDVCIDVNFILVGYMPPKKEVAMLLLEDKRSVDVWTVGYEMRNDQLWSIPEPVPSVMFKVEKRINNQLKRGGAKMDIGYTAKFREVYVSHDEGLEMLFCEDERCIGNKPINILGKDDIEVYNFYVKWFPWLIDMDKKYPYQYPKLSLRKDEEWQPTLKGSMIELLRSRGRYLAPKELDSEARKIQHELYIAWQSIRELGRLSGSTPIGVLKEISHQDTGRYFDVKEMNWVDNHANLGEKDLVCPFCGSKAIRMDAGGHPEEATNDEEKIKALLGESYQDFELKSEGMDLNLKDDLKEERKFFKAYRHELDLMDDVEYDSLLWTVFGNAIPKDEDEEEEEIDEIDQLSSNEDSEEDILN